MLAGRFFFTLSYWFNNLPWDTGITPPEVEAFLERTPPGRALDLGCGTGTNVIFLAERGWAAEGVDFVPRAIRRARRKAASRGLKERTQFRVGDVLSPQAFSGSYDLVLDIGCFHSLSGPDIHRYLALVSGHLSPGGSLLLYVHLNENPGPGHGTREADLELLEAGLELFQRTDGGEGSRPSAWLEFRQRG